MNNNLKIILGTVAGIMIGGLTVVGANQAIQALQNTDIKISLNGQVQKFKDETTGEVQYPITYHDRTYLPLRNIAQLAGLNVDYDNNTNTALLKKESNEAKNSTISVEDAVNYKDGYYNLFNIRLPRIIGNTNTVSELNKKILNNVLRRTYQDFAMHALTKDEKLTVFDKGAIYDYKYIIKDDILIIYVYSYKPEGSSNYFPASGNGTNEFNFYYDIINDKELSTSQVAKKLNISLNSITKYTDEKVNSYEELDDSNYNFIMRIEQNEIKLVSEF